MRKALTAEKAAKIFEDVYSRVALTYDPTWIPTGSKAWDEIPTLSRRFIVLVMEEFLKELSQYSYEVD